MLNKSRPWSISTLGVQIVSATVKDEDMTGGNWKAKARAQKTHQERLWLAAPANSPWCSFEVFFILTWYMEKSVYITKEMTMAKNRQHSPYIKKKRRKKGLLRFASFQKTIQKKNKGKPNWVGTHLPTKGPQFSLLKQIFYSFSYRNILKCSIKMQKSVFEQINC